MAEDNLQTLPVPEGEPLRALRAVEVLERIQTPAARQFLETLSKGPVSRTTRAANAALARIDPVRNAGANARQEADDLWEKHWEDLAEALAALGPQGDLGPDRSPGANGGRAESAIEADPGRGSGPAAPAGGAARRDPAPFGPSKCWNASARRRGARGVATPA